MVDGGDRRMSVKISGKVSIDGGSCHTEVATNDVRHGVDLGAKAEAPGAATNGGELLCLALATCFANDVYREAQRDGVQVSRVEVVVDAEFGGRGDPARSLAFRVRVSGDDDPKRLRRLVEDTDGVAEIQNTLRLGIPVELVDIQVE